MPPGRRATAAPLLDPSPPPLTPLPRARAATEQAERALEAREVPVGCVLVQRAGAGGEDAVLAAGANRTNAALNVCMQRAPLRRPCAAPPPPR